MARPCLSARATKKRTLFSLRLPLETGQKSLWYGTTFNSRRFNWGRGPPHISPTLYWAIAVTISYLTVIWQPWTILTPLFVWSWHPRVIGAGRLPRCIRLCFIQSYGSGLRLTGPMTKKPDPEPNCWKKCTISFSVAVLIMKIVTKVQQYLFITSFTVYHFECIHYKAQCFSK